MSSNIPPLWDEKFGFVDEDNVSQRMKEQAIYKQLTRVGSIVDGVGKDAEIDTNKLGGKQSHSPYAPHLLDPDFLDAMVSEEGPLHYVADYMRNPEYATPLFIAIEYRLEGEEDLSSTDLKAKRLLTISQVLKEGADKYKANNWRLIPSEQHLSHAITHYLAYLRGDTQDDHLAHFYCRLMMTYATIQSSDFSYTNYIDKC